MGKTFLKVCPVCDTKKKSNQTTCEKCGYDFKNNKLYNMQDDVRETNILVRKYIKKQNRKELFKKITTLSVIFSVIGVIATYILTHKENE